MSIPLTLSVFERGSAGVPAISVPIIDLRTYADSYQHSISDRFGFETATVSMKVDIQDGLNWLQNGLMRPLIVSGPSRATCWEGFLETVSLTMGQKRASLSLSNMANNVRYLWTDLLGRPGDTAAVATAASTLSQSLYGRKDYMGSLPKILDAAMAQTAGAKTLQALAFPRSNESTEARTGEVGDIWMDLVFAGWYSTLDWVLFSNSSQFTSVTNTQLSTTILPAYAAINPFLSTDYTGITYTGPTMTQYVAHFSTIKQVVDRLCLMGDSVNNPLAWGVYENRAFQAVTSAAATPTTITYLEDAGTGKIYDRSGATVKPWDVRPNAMSQVQQLLDVGPNAGATDLASRKYVSRVTFSAQGDSIGCTLEPGGASGIDALVAAFPPTYFWRG